MNTPNPTPMERITRLLDFAQSHKRDQIALSRADLEYLVRQLHSQPALAYKGETPQA